MPPEAAPDEAETGPGTNRHVRATAQQYDTLTAHAFEPWDRLLIQRLVAERRRRPPGGMLLEIGAGTAVLLTRIAARPELADVALIASDYFADMLAVARTRLAAAGYAARVAVRREDVHALGFADASLRYVISRSTMHHWADPVAALHEIRRVLEPGGVALLHDVRRDAPAALVQRLDAARRLGGIGPMRLAEKFTPDEVAAMCRAADLGNSARISTLGAGAAALGFELRIAA